MAVDGRRRRTAVSLLAVDGGGSKVDAVLVGRDGAVVYALRFRNTDHDGTSSDAYLDGVEIAVDMLRATAGGRLPLASLGMYCLAGADLPADDRRIAR
jgi:N-acetylglucosamine kinase-like BadF-type ATPase